ncbi:MAG: glycosyltransferase family 39 protein [Bryobacterales bacterium]|nr:glycosyltransferase family 39 protein [Bryobacterales bacterium]
MTEHNAAGLLRPVLWTVFAGTTAVFAYGLATERLFAQQIWTRTGLERLLAVSGGYVVLAASCFPWRKFFGPALAILGLCYAGVATGPIAVAAGLLFVLSCCALGDLLRSKPHHGGSFDAALSFLTGAAVYIGLIGIAAHFPVNRPLFYFILLGGPLLLNRPRVVAALRRCLTPSDYPSHPAEYLLVSLIGFIIVLHLLAVLKPEVSADGLAMHLAVPAWVARHGYWNFDVTRFTWGVMPMGGEWCYTAAYLLGKEYAARLINFAMLLAGVAVLFELLRRHLSRRDAFLCVTLFASTPLVQLVSGSLFVENVWMALLLAAFACMLRFRDTWQASHLYLAALLAGAALATKLLAAVYILPLSVFLLYDLWVGIRSGKITRPARLLLITMACFILIGIQPYATALIKTGNPVFPLLNTIFHSPYFDQTGQSSDMRFRKPFQWDTLYQLTFRTEQYLEGQAGAFGFQSLIFLPLAAVMLSAHWPYAGWAAMAASFIYMVAVFEEQANVRYLYPVMPLLCLVIGLVFARVRQYVPRLYRLLSVTAIAVVLLNIAFLPASGWYHKDLALWPLTGLARAAYIEGIAPVRLLIPFLNSHFPGQPVAFIETSDIAELDAESYVASWHDYLFARQLAGAHSAEEIHRVLKQAGAGLVIFPRPGGSIPVSQAALEEFLSRYVDPVAIAAGYQAARVRAMPLRRTGTVVSAGDHDDAAGDIAYHGAWLRNHDFAETRNRTVTYSNVPGDRFTLRFQGAEIVWIHTRAANRGIAEILLDGTKVAELDLYRKVTEWQAEAHYTAPGPGPHEFDVRVSGRKNPASTDVFVDVDALTVR